MIVQVKWQKHDRIYTIGISRFLQELNLDVNDAQIQSAIKHLLEQEEMQSGE